MPKTRLSLKKERLAELATEDLHLVVAAAGDAVTTLDGCIGDIRTLHGCTTNIYCP